MGHMGMCPWIREHSLSMTEGNLRNTEPRKTAGCVPRTASCKMRDEEKESWQLAQTDTERDRPIWSLNSNRYTVYEYY